MKNKLFAVLALPLLAAFHSHFSTARAQGSAFTYQGRLNSGTNPATGTFDLTFALFSVNSGAGQVGSTVTNSATAVSNGLFAVTLDFGAGVFDGTARWLELGVRTNGGGAFTTLVPRQPVTSTPYAIQAANFSGLVAATQITGTLASSNIGSGTITSGDIAAGAVTAANIASNTITAAQLAPGAAAINLNAGNQSGVGSGGLVLSATEFNAALVNAGYVEIGATTLTDAWLQRTNGTPPAARYLHTAVWTGSEMIIWGGSVYNYYTLNDGGSYTPASDSWTAVTTNGAPTPRQLHTAVWTGSAMIVWGGQDYDGNSLGDGGLYNPTLNSWTAVTTNGAPVKRVWHTAVWTGTNMIVWGGNNGLGGPGTIMNTGGSYNPSSNSWTVVTTNGAPSARQLHTAVWTGSQMIIWGGDGGINTGGVYNPSSNSWTTVTTSGAPVGRGYHTAVWTGSEMIVWGGESASGLLNDGGRYNPANNSWIAVTTTGAPGPRFFHTAVWTGTEMIVWGGTSNNGVNVLNDGGRYNPVTGTWTATSIVGAPPARDSHTAVWTGSQMLVFGGATLSTGLNDTWSYYTPGAVLYLYERP